MPRVIHIVDVVRRGAYDLGPEVTVLRVPYDMFQPKGPVRRNGDEIEWLEGKALRSARFVDSTLGECHPGERVLARLPPYAPADEWWLCEIESVDGVAAAQ
jgi:hypothetical protein